MTLLVVVVADEQILVGADGKATFVDPSPDPDQHTQFTAVAADKFKQVGDRVTVWVPETRSDARSASSTLMSDRVVGERARRG